jgi:uncharacterized membrane protein YgcG
LDRRNQPIACGHPSNGYARGVLGGITLVFQSKARSYATRPTRGYNAQNTPQEHQRRVLVRLILAVYWLLIFEGALRKWVFPQFSWAIFFIRDPLVVAIYLYAFSKRMQLRRSALLACGVAFAAITLPLILLQAACLGRHFSLLVAVYGWRNYFLYIPLAFCIAQYFDEKDIASLIRSTLLLSMPMAVLVYFQFLSPGSAPINQGFGSGDEDVFKNSEVALGIVRTFGTFTSSMGETLFVASIISMVLAVWLMPEEQRPLKGMWLLAVTASSLVCLGLSGSRTAFVWSGIAFVSAMGASIVVGPKRLKIGVLLTPIVLLVVAAVFIPIALPKASEAFMLRWREADRIETTHYGAGGIFSRALFSLLSFRLLLTDTPLQGYQMGVSGNGAGKVMQSVVSLTPEEEAAGEYDWARHILELGTIMGPLFIVFRIFLCCWILREAISATRRSGSSLPMIWFVLPGVLLFYGLITGNGTANGYAWLLAGWSMAINRMPSRAQLDRARLFDRPSPYYPVAV